MKIGRLLITGGKVITPRGIVEADVAVEDGRIQKIGHALSGTSWLDASGCVVSPGLVQAHVHLCQTLCRGGADDLPLLEWLRQRVWPYEASLDEAAMRACVRLAIAELLLGGTTAILDMGTVHETDALADEVAKSGLRAVLGKAMMDVGDGVPERLRESTRNSLAESDALRARWQGAANGRIGWAYAPRFVLSCTEELLREVAGRVQAGSRVHTHASEQLSEIELVRRERGDDNISYLAKLGLGGDRATLAHCVHATPAERKRLAADGTHVAHCPSSNLKLGSGIAPIPEMLSEGIYVALGADGAPCNNNLDAFLEMRLGALLHKPRVGPAGMTAKMAFELATMGGARALGLGGVIGSIEPGKKADLIVVDLQTPHAAPSADPISTLVYGSQSRDVKHVIVDGRILVRDGKLTEVTGLDRAEVVARAHEQAARLR
jgi:cytosine/adenosine deaminase-related metal-dependent hydrolase